MANSLRFDCFARVRKLAVILMYLMFLGSCAHAQNKPVTGQQDVKALVAQEAINLGVPISLALAVAHTESNFDPKAESHKGARGVMQIMPATARGEYGIEPDLLWDARINIRVGLHFLRRLLEKYQGRVELALSYYNGGSRVGILPRAKVIPATRPYVAKVKRLQKHYRRTLRNYSLAT